MRSWFPCSPSCVIRSARELHSRQKSLPYAINFSSFSVGTRNGACGFGANRFLSVWPSRIWSECRSALRVVKPETVIASQRLSTLLVVEESPLARVVRPPRKTCGEVIRRMSAANPRWGAPRIHGELGKFRLKVSERRGGLASRRCFVLRAHPSRTLRQRSATEAPVHCL